MEVFSTFASVFDPGNGKIEPAFLRIRLAFFRDAANNDCRFFRISVWILLRNNEKPVSYIYHSFNGKICLLFGQNSVRT